MTDTGSRRAIVAITGGIGSGKSTIARLFAADQGWPLASFGGYLRRLARSPDESTREYLQDLGQGLVERDPVQFARLVLADAGWPTVGSMVVDGVRHLAVMDGIRRIAGDANVFLVAIAAPSDIRARRKEMTEAELLATEAHEVEREVASVVAQAVITLDGTQNPVGLVEEIRRLAKGP